MNHDDIIKNIKNIKTKFPNNFNRNNVEGLNYYSDPWMKANPGRSYQDDHDFFKPGEIVVFNGQSEAQRKYCGSDANAVLVVGREYEVESVDLRRWSCRITLKHKSGRFNSVCFSRAM